VIIPEMLKSTEKKDNDIGKNLMMERIERAVKLQKLDNIRDVVIQTRIN